MSECIVTSSLLIAVLIALRFIFRGKISRRLQYALWGLALLRLLMPFSLLQSPASVMNAFDTARIKEAVPDIQVYSDMIRNSELSPDEARAAGNGTLHEIQGSPAGSGSEGLRSYIFTDSLANVLARISGFVWLIGSAALGLWFLGANLAFYHTLRKNRTPYSFESCRLPVYVTEHLVSPCLFGVFRPAIYLTPKAAEDDVRLKHALTHELCHYAHGDHAWSFLRGLCLAAYWWNPLVWAAAVFSRTDSELACDEAVVSAIGEDDRLSYGRSLVEMIVVKKAASGLMYAATSMTSGKRGIKQRLVMIAGNPKTYIPALTAVLLAVAVCVGCTFTGAQSERAQAGVSENAAERAETLYALRNPYIGDASADLKLLNAMDLSDAFGSYVISLDTDEEPYVLTIIFDYPIGDKEAFDSEMNKNSVLLLALIDNAAEIRWQYIYGEGSDILTSSLDIEKANDSMGGDIKSFSRSADQLRGLLERLDPGASGVDRTDLDACVSEAILSENTGRYLEGGFAAEAHTTLKVMENGNTVTVYAMALSMEFAYLGDAFSEMGGSHMPVAITFEKNDIGEYSLKEYWIPRDGSEYAKSLKEKFPSSLYNGGMLNTQKYIMEHVQVCYAKAIEHGSVPVDQHLSKLIETICSSPAVSSRPGDYIDAHPIEYRELLYYGNYTLRYVYGEFLTGGQTGLSGHIMLAAMKELLGDEAPDIGLAGTAQERFDQWKGQVIQTRSRVEISKPKTAILFEKMDQRN